MGRRRRNKKRFPRNYCPIETFEIKKYSHRAEGLSEYKGKELRIRNSVFKEKVKIWIRYEDQFFFEATIEKIVEKSKERKLDIDHPKLMLGSYQTAHLSNKEHDKFKNDQIEKTFGPNINNIIVGKRNFYRNKISLTRGGFMPPGPRRRYSIIPINSEQFDLMDIDWNKYKNDELPIRIIRRLETEISDKPGTKISVYGKMLGKKFSVSLDSFYQVNDEMAELAYKDIINHTPKNQVVLDLFGGGAIIGILVSDIAKKVYSVDINNDNHLDAKKNIELNNSKNVVPILSDVNKWLLNNKDLVNGSTVILDPARAGVLEESLEIINDSNVERIIYLSCNIFSQKKDIDVLDNFKITYMQPYDFFPQTYHIENLIVLDKKN
ncbi:MAG: hypothetical protein K4H23_05165 [Mollicutes bacterium PWAP]|nr:hypothetical protein [Mollicutes bacterium PWAP]